MYEDTRTKKTYLADQMPLWNYTPYPLFASTLNILLPRPQTRLPNAMTIFSSTHMTIRTADEAELSMERGDKDAVHQKVALRTTQGTRKKLH